MQIKMFPRLERYDVEFDLPEAFLPEFPPAMFLQSRPELGDVSRGEVVSINNYYRLFKDLLTAVQLDGLRLLVTPFPQEEFNPTGDRKTVEPSLGVTCFDCQRTDTPADSSTSTPTPGPSSGACTRYRQPPRPVQPADTRLEAEPTLGRGLHRVRAAHGLLQRGHDHAIKKGMNILDRIQVTHMAQMQNMLDFPPAPKLTSPACRPGEGDGERTAGQKLFFGKAQSACHPAPFISTTRCTTCTWSDSKNEAGDGPIKASRSAGSRTARRTSTTAVPDPGGHRRVLQPRPGTQTHSQGKAQSG